jgi:hypothetical protein
VRWRFILSIFKGHAMDMLSKDCIADIRELTVEELVVINGAATAVEYAQMLVG